MNDTPFPDEPLHNIEWWSAGDLRANGWNPNRVFSQELRLLEHSILATGWIQPLIINGDGLIIDGFHRWRLSQDSKKIHARWGGQVPCVALDIGDDEAMAMTVRINRAKGTHSAIAMHELVASLVDDHGWDIKRICQEIGANKKEVETLLAEGIFTARNISKWAYSPAWYPGEDGDGPNEGLSDKSYDDAVAVLEG